MQPSAYQVQNDLARLSAQRDVVIWDRYAENEGSVLEQKIHTLLPGDNPNVVELRKNIFKKVWEQRKYTEGILLSTIIYVIVAKEITEQEARNSTSFTCHPVFCTKKCIKNGSALGCCMMFIDEQARVYSNWSDFLKNNKLPPGMMIAPKDGVYTFDRMDEVVIHFQLTPAASTLGKLTNATDTAAAIGSIAATLPVLSAGVCAVAPPVLLAAAVVGATTSVYTAVRSASELVDRKQHDESTGLTDRIALKSWVGLASGIAGAGSSGATKLLQFSSMAGRDISLATRVGVNMVNASSIVISGAGIGINIYDIHLKKQNSEEITNEDLLYLSTSIMIFTHSINNFAIAKKITSSRQQNAMNCLRESMNSLVERRNSSYGSSGSELMRTFNSIPDIGGLAKLLFGTVATTQLTDEQLLHLLLELGPRAYRHIVSFNTISDLINSMLNFLTERATYVVLQISEMFIDMFVTTVEQMAATVISTESVIYEILRIIVQRTQNEYKPITANYIESIVNEIMDGLRQYYFALTRVPSGVAKLCKICGGEYYMTV